jgi:ribonuclease D
VYLFIDNDVALREAITILHRQPALAFDLEFDRDRHTYGFDLCLMQIGYADTCIIIDPVAIHDLKPVFEVFENPAIKKLVHCPGEDLRLLHSLGCYPANLADTEVMAKLLNYEQTSLAKLLESKCGVQLNKKQQQSNWHKRPLSPEQLAYAADDVLYLFRLFETLQKEITEKGYELFVAEEFDLMQQVRYTLEPKTLFLKPGELRKISDWDAFVLNELFRLRDTIAQKKNKPAYMIMPEDSLRRIASQTLDYRMPSAIPGLHPSLRHGQMAKELQSNIAAIFAEAGRKGLDRKIRRNPFTAEQRELYTERKNRQNRLKDKIFGPIQKHIADTMGDYAARYIISNAWVTKWLAGELNWHDLQPAYKRKMIEETAGKLGIPFEEILDYDGLEPIESSNARDAFEAHR